MSKPILYVVGLGYFRDSQRSLVAAAAYLQEGK